MKQWLLFAVSPIPIVAVLFFGFGSNVRSQSPPTTSTPAGQQSSVQTFRLDADPVFDTGVGWSILTPTQGVDFKAYIEKVLRLARGNWYKSMPEEGKAGRRGIVSIVFEINPDGTVPIGEPTIAMGSGVEVFDKAAADAIRSSEPFDALPKQFSGPYLKLRLVFLYNISPSQTSSALATANELLDASQPPYDRLELLGSVSASMYQPYLLKKLSARGIDFTPDATFLGAVATRDESAELRNAIVDSKPHQGVSESSERRKAYLILVDLVGHQPTPAIKEKYEAALALAPKSAALHLAYAGSLLLLQDYPAAEVQERLSLELWPGDAEAHVGLAAALTGEGHDDEAVPEATEALRIYPNHKGALVELGMALTRDRQYKDAVPVLREALARPPEMPLLHKYLGLSLFKTGDIEGASNQDVLYLQTYPNDAEAHYDLGVAYRSQGHRDDAQAQFREAARLDPSNPVYSALANPSTADNGPQGNSGQGPNDGLIDGNTYRNSFFRFSLQFPDGWTVMGQDAQRKLTKVGGDILAGGDERLEDAAQAAAAHVYPLLFVMGGKSRVEEHSTRSIQISALDLGTTGNTTSAEAF